MNRQWIILAIILTAGQFMTCLSELQAKPEAEFVLVSPESQATIVISKQEPEYVQLAVQDLVNDVKKISGKTMKVVSDPKQCQGNCLVVGTVTDPVAAGWFGKLNSADAASLNGKWEAYRVKTTGGKLESINQPLVIAGSNPRGTMFGIYHFIEEYLKVDPFYFWTGIEPEKRSELAWEKVEILQDEPSFKFRGWFINDEDLLTEFVNGGGKRELDYPYYGQVVHPEAFRPVVEALVRSRFNLIIPASFIDIMNAPERKLVEESARRGLYLSQHHVEPMGVSAFTFFNYWKAKGKDPKFSFYSNREEVEEVWKLYASEWAKFPDVIWQIGLRGIADRPMWMADPNVPQSDAERGALISEAMQVQKEMIRAVDSRDNSLVTTTLWAEGAGLNQDGHLTFPENTIIVFADNSPGWKWQQDFYETEREEGRKYGVYYHHQLWSSGPHLVQAVPPAQTYKMFSLAAQHQADEYAIMNVSNIREFVLGISASAAMLWDLAEFEPDNFLSSWTKQIFGENASRAEQAYRKFFESYPLHPDTGTPYTLDGQIRSVGNGALYRLRLQLTDSVKYQELLEKEEQQTEVNSWGSRFLSDMHPERGMSVQEYQQALIIQNQQLEAAGKSIDQAIGALSGDKKLFLQANLKTQHLILQSLNSWAREIINAKLSAEKKDLEKIVTHLNKALEAIKTANQSKEVASSGNWQHWYRGDKKMNLPAVETNTHNLLKQAEALFVSLNLKPDSND